jgi:hypothetical protein
MNDFGFVGKYGDTYKKFCTREGKEGAMVTDSEELVSVKEYSEAYPERVISLTIDPLVELSASVKLKRDSLITAIEWRRSRYKDEVSLGLEPTEALQPILEYIQALRDITKQERYPTEITWPEVPA